MNKELELIGVPVGGPEEDYLLTSEEQGPNSLLSMTGLLSQAGARRITWQEATAFETPDSEHFAVYKNNYLEYHGRVPRVYKIKLTVEVEELSEEESQKFWETKSQNS
jgi:hypothetical protein